MMLEERETAGRILSQLDRRKVERLRGEARELGLEMTARKMGGEMWFRFFQHPPFLSMFKLSFTSSLPYALYTAYGVDEARAWLDGFRRGMEMAKGKEERG